MVKTISLGCRPRTHPIEEIKNCYDDNRRTVIPGVGQFITAVNEAGEEIIIKIEPK